MRGPRIYLAQKRIASVFLQYFICCKKKMVFKTRRCRVCFCQMHDWLHNYGLFLFLCSHDFAKCDLLRLIEGILRDYTIDFFNFIESFKYPKATSTRKNFFRLIFFLRNQSKFQNYSGCRLKEIMKLNLSNFVVMIFFPSNRNWIKIELYQT